jgi:hypothetical protein
MDPNYALFAGAGETFVGLEPLINQKFWRRDVDHETGENSNLVHNCGDRTFHDCL